MSQYDSDLEGGKAGDNNPWVQFIKANKGKGLNFKDLSKLYQVAGHTVVPKQKPEGYNLTRGTERACLKKPRDVCVTIPACTLRKKGCARLPWTNPKVQELNGTTLPAGLIRTRSRKPVPPPPNTPASISAAVPYVPSPTLAFQNVEDDTFTARGPRVADCVKIKSRKYCNEMEKCSWEAKYKVCIPLDQ